MGWVHFQNGSTTLHQAALRGHAELVRALGGTHGAALDAQDNDGCTPLHCAARWGKTAAARALLELGANTSVRHMHGQTALDVAVQYGIHEIAWLLRDPLDLLPSGQAHGCDLADAALAPVTRLRVDPHGDGTYTRFEKKTFGDKVHFVRFDGAEPAAEPAAEQPLQLKSLGPAAWSVLLPGAGDRGGHRGDRDARRRLARLDRGAARPGDRRSARGCAEAASADRQ